MVVKFCEGGNILNNESWEKVTGKGKGQYKDVNKDYKRCKVKLNEDGSLERLDVFVDKDKDGNHNHLYVNNKTKEHGFKKRK